MALFDVPKFFELPSERASRAARDTAPLIQQFGAAFRQAQAQKFEEAENALDRAAREKAAELDREARRVQFEAGAAARSMALKKMEFDLGRAEATAVSDAELARWGNDNVNATSPDQLTDIDMSKLDQAGQDKFWKMKGEKIRRMTGTTEVEDAVRFNEKLLAVSPQHRAEAKRRLGDGEGRDTVEPFLDSVMPINRQFPGVTGDVKEALDIQALKDRRQEVIASGEPGSVEETARLSNLIADAERRTAGTGVVEEVFSPSGERIFSRRTGAAAAGGGPSRAFKTVIEKDVREQLAATRLTHQLYRNIRPQDVGIRGVVGEFADRMADNLGMLGFSVTVDEARAENRTTMALAFEKMMRQVSTENRFTDRDEKRVRAIGPSSKVWESFPRAVAAIETVNKAFANRTVSDLILGKVEEIPLDHFNVPEKRAALRWNADPGKKDILSPELETELADESVLEWVEFGRKTKDEFFQDEDTTAAEVTAAFRAGVITEEEATRYLRLK